MTVMVLSTLLDPALVETTSVTFRNPGVEYACKGFFSVLVMPSPKSHFQEVGFPDEASMNWTGCPTLGNFGPYVKATLRYVVFVPAPPVIRFNRLLVSCAVILATRSREQAIISKEILMFLISFLEEIGFLFISNPAFFSFQLTLII